MHKAEESRDSRCSVTLSLADGSRWTIRATDEPTARLVSKLGRAMRLTPGAGGREVYAVICRERMHDRRLPSRTGTAVCWLSPLDRPDLKVIAMERVAASVALQLLPGGGLLLHGALAEYKGSGYIMAGPSGVGKSTSSRRLPPPHRSLCDDRTLVLRDHAGRYWAHPWPTWSQFRDDLEASWPVEAAVPLRGVFFLSQSPSERLLPTGRIQATGKIMESAIDLTRTVTRLSESGEFPLLWKGHLALAKDLAAAVPVYSLEMSLHGEFWREIEQVLPAAGDIGARLPASDRKGGSTFRVKGRSRATEASSGKLRTVCLGRAMNPTLNEADILQIEPFGRRKTSPGDIVCFKSPENDETCVRRVASVRRRETEDGRPEDEIRTRGDDNQHNDPWTLRSRDIVGKVVAVQRGSRWLPVAGGLGGQVTVALLSRLRPLRVWGQLTRRRLRNVVTGAVALDRVLPQGLRPRALEFNGRNWVDLRLLFGGYEVGRYDCYLQTWRIRRFYRLFVDMARLPAPPRWSLPGFVRKRPPFLRPRQPSLSAAEPKLVAEAGQNSRERNVLPDLPGNVRRSGIVCPTTSVMVDE